MMRQYLLRTFGLATLALSLHTTGWAQQNDDDAVAVDTAIGPHTQQKDEIVIQHKNDKDVKITIEIKNNQVFINGKPVESFDNSDIAVRRQKIMIVNGQPIPMPDVEGLTGVIAPPPVITFSSPEPFKGHSGTLSMDMNEWPGNAKRPFLGVTTTKPDNEDGAQVKEVAKGSAAEKAGLKEGDVITRVDETDIDGPQTLSNTIVEKYKPADKATITYKRAGKSKKATVVLGEHEAVRTFKSNIYRMPDLRMEPGQPFEPRGFEFRENAKPRLGIKAQDTEEGKGAKVLEVADASAAENAGIAQGDIITQFDGKDVNNATDLIQLAQASRNKTEIKVSVIREGKPLELVIKAPKKLRTADL